MGDLSGVEHPYGTIVADPPWPIADGGTAPSSSWGKPKPGRLPYRTMSVEEIAALSMPALADDNAHLYLWTVNAFVVDAYAIARTWGFKPTQLLTWAKPPRGLGLGGAFTNTTEFVLFAWRGSCKPLARQDTSWWNWPRGAHSAKPEAFYDLVERVSPGPYIELFSRRARLGWDTWGDEALHGTDFVTGTAA